MDPLRIDIIEWDGKYLCALAGSYILVFEPGYTATYDQRIVDLVQLNTTRGRVMALDEYPLEQLPQVHAAVITAWSEWETKTEDSLLRHSAGRIYCRDGYDSPIIHETVEEVFDRVGRKLKRHRNSS